MCQRHVDTAISDLWILCIIRIKGGSNEMMHTHTTHARTHNHFIALWILSGTNQVSLYQKKHSPAHTYHGHQSSLICFLHVIRSMASSLFSLRSWQSFVHNLSPSFLWSTSWTHHTLTPYISSRFHSELYNPPNGTLHSKNSFSSSNFPEWSA